MLERHGIVTRETAIAEGVPGGFASIYGELQNLELLGTARRGYFVEGLGGAQFALPGAVERLRSLPREEGHDLVLAATDPANPYGAALSWPESDGEVAAMAGATVTARGEAGRTRPAVKPCCIPSRPTTGSCQSLDILMSSPFDYLGHPRSDHPPMYRSVVSRRHCLAK